MKARLANLFEANQKQNMANFERIHELIDEQETKIMEIQDEMRDHTNCLVQILELLKDSNGLTNVCPYASLVNITPVDNDYLLHSNH